MSGQESPNHATAVPTASDVAVIICAYTEERWDDIVSAVESALSQPSVGEVALVIDHNEALPARSKEKFGDQIIIVTNKHKQGLSGARDSGIEATTKPIITFLDDDATAREGWLESQVRHYKDPDVMGVGGLIEPKWQTKRPAWWPDEFDWIVGCTYRGLPTELSRTRNPIGASMSVRRSAFNEVGGFSSSLGRVGKNPAGAEETELFIRIHRQIENAIVLYDPESIVDHRVGAERATVSYFRRRCYAEGLSKAIVSQRDKGGNTLTTERSYVLKTLPSGVLRGIRETVKGDPSGIKRSAAIAGGLLTTTAGYLRGRLVKSPERNLTEVPHSSEAA